MCQSGDPLMAPATHHSVQLSQLSGIQLLGRARIAWRSGPRRCSSSSSSTERRSRPEHHCRVEAEWVRPRATGSTSSCASSSKQVRERVRRCVRPSSLSSLPGPRCLRCVSTCRRVVLPGVRREEIREGVGRWALRSPLASCCCSAWRAERVETAESSHSAHSAKSSHSALATLPTHSRLHLHHLTVNSVCLG